MTDPRYPAKSHGTVNGYRGGCRCADCEGAWSEYLDRQAVYRAKQKGRGVQRGEVRKVSKQRASTCRCDVPLGTEECLKCGREVACSAA